MRSTNKGSVVTCQESFSSYTDIVLDDFVLKATKQVSDYNVTKSISASGIERVVSKTLVNQSSEEVSFKLMPTDREALLEYRRSKISGLIFKKNSKLYFCEIPAEMTYFPNGLVGEHLCALFGRDCNRLYAKSDEEGGCAKVRNRARGIEYYRWITSGFETFNTHKDVFVVGVCTHFKA